MLLIIVSIVFPFAILKVASISDKNKRKLITDLLRGPLQLLFAMHDIMFSTIVLGVFYMLAKKK